MKTLEEILYNNTKEALKRKFGEYFNKINEFEQMSLIKTILDQLYNVYKDVEEKDISLYHGVITINGYIAPREFVYQEWYTNEMFGRPNIEYNLIQSITNNIIQEIQEITGRKRKKDIWLIFLMFKEDKKIKKLNLNNNEIVKRFS